VFRRRRFFEGKPVRGNPFLDISWLTPDGQLMSDEHWQTEFAKSLQVFLNGEGLASRDPRGNLLTDDSFLLLLNAHHEALTFRLPPEGPSGPWTVVLDTTEPTLRGMYDPEELDLGQERKVEAHAIVVLRRDAA
jgi:isoamylase